MISSQIWRWLTKGLFKILVQLYTSLLWFSRLTADSLSISQNYHGRRRLEYDLHGAPPWCYCQSRTVKQHSGWNTRPGITFTPVCWWRNAQPEVRPDLIHWRRRRTGTRTDPFSGEEDERCSRSNLLEMGLAIVTDMVWWWIIARYESYRVPLMASLWCETSLREVEKKIEEKGGWSYRGEKDPKGVYSSVGWVD